MASSCPEPPPTQCLQSPLVLSSPSAKSWYPKLQERPTRQGGSVVGEVASILCLTGPMVGAGILFYLRSLVSMVFLGRLGQLPLAGGSLALGFANITGYSVLSGLAGGMDPVCGQAFGAGRTDLLRAALRRTVAVLAAASLPVALLWVGHAPGAGCILHPIRIYLRAQSVTLPLTYGAAAALLLHVPINFLLVTCLGLGVRGVALGGVWTNLNFLLFLLAYVYFTGMYHDDDDTADKKHTTTHRLVANKHTDDDGEEEEATNKEVEEWWSLVRLCVHSCMSVCLEWWWYEIMVLLCGVLVDPKAAVAAMGVLIQTTSLIYIFPHSLGCAVSTRVGHELGAARPDRARLVARVGLGLGAALGLVACAFAVSTAGCGVLRGSARPEKAARINVSAFYGVGMPVALALAFWPLGLDFRGMWGGMLAAQLVCAGLMLRAVLGTDWAEQTERARQLTGGRGDGIVAQDKPAAAGHAQPAKAEVQHNTLFMVPDCV
ncbi:hypothetical protein PR202_ga16392 [Eleusine coracana subsp. coracana]|uniref:Protein DETOXIFICATION n=1 Tax=Eleusine coracana subsp. coracana TaxID=191504 RepID=A0AAV5CLV1_ELECO|nr:hypothetical protein PR202_ga16392 [Eleusine coracana subsp. coracana]